MSLFVLVRVIRIKWHFDEHVHQNQNARMPTIYFCEKRLWRMPLSVDILTIILSLPRWCTDAVACINKYTVCRSQLDRDFCLSFEKDLEPSALSCAVFGSHDKDPTPEED